MTLPLYLQEHVDRLNVLSHSIHNWGYIIVVLTGVLIGILACFVFIYVSDCVKEHQDNMRAKRKLARMKAKARKARKKAQKKRREKAAAKKAFKSALKRAKKELKESELLSPASASAPKSLTEASSGPHVKFTGEAQPIDLYTTKNFKKVETKWSSTPVSDSHIPGTDSFGTSVPSISDTLSDHSKKEIPQTTTPFSHKIAIPDEVEVNPKPA